MTKITVMQQNYNTQEFKNKKSKLSETSAPMKHLKYLLQIFSIDSGARRITYAEKWHFFFNAAIVLVILATVDILGLLYKLRNVYAETNISIAATDMMQIGYDYAQYIVDLVFVYKYGNERTVEYFKQYESFDDILGMVRYTAIKNKLSKLIAMFAFIWIGNSSFDFIAWERSYSWKVPVAYAIAYIFFLIKILTTLDLVAHIINIECRLRVIGDIVLDYYCVTKSLPSMENNKELLRDCIRNENWFYSEACSKPLQMQAKPRLLKSPATNNCYQMKWISRCYLLLTEQCYFINNMFGIRILLNSLSMLIDMVRFINVSVRIANGTQETKYNAGLLPVVANMGRLVSCVSLLICLVHHSEKAYRQRDRIVRIINHLLINKNPEATLRAPATELRELVVTQPISFNMAYFFELNNSYLVSMASVVVTYSIILLQSS